MKSIQEKAARIRECIASMMDIQPIQVVGKDHPAKEENKKKEKEKKVNG